MQGRAGRATTQFALKSEKATLGLMARDVIVQHIVRTVFPEDGRMVEVAVKVTSASTILRWSTSLRAPTG